MKDIDQLSFNEFGLSSKEEKILKAAVTIFYDKGYNGTTTKEIAGKAGVAEGTIFRYFKTKKDILHSIVIFFIDKLAASLVIKNVNTIFLKTEGDLKTILNKFIFDRIALVRKMLPVSKVAFTEALLNKEVREVIRRRMIDPAYDIFRAFYKKMSERKEIRTDIKPDNVIRCIAGNLIAFIIQKAIIEEDLDLKSLKDEVDDMIEVIIGGIGYRGDPE
jgi:AcrR family transcriptional regulator